MSGSRADRDHPCHGLGLSRVLWRIQARSGRDCEDPCRGLGGPGVVLRTPLQYSAPASGQMEKGNKNIDFDKEVYDFLTKVVILIRRSDIFETKSVHFAKEV